jgi:hypothetical protein
MKTNNLIRLSAILVILLGLIFTGCKKNTSEDQTPKSSSSIQQLTTDGNDVENNSDDAMNDANGVISPGGGLKSTQFIPCHATLDSTPVVNDTITYYIHYNGLTCDQKKFITGEIEISKNVNISWHTPGATVLVKFIDFKVTRVATGKSMTFNGTKKYTNVSGGYIWQLGYQIQALIHRVSGTIQVTFDDNTTRTWHIERQRTLTRVIIGTDAHLILTIDGQGSADGLNNLVVWGVTRDGENFYSQITQSVVIKEACSWNPCCGIEVFQIPASSKSATVTFGYDSSNNPVPCDSNNCPTEFKVDWTINNQSGTFYVVMH